MRHASSHRPYIIFYKPNVKKHFHRFQLYVRPSLYKLPAHAMHSISKLNSFWLEIETNIAYLSMDIQHAQTLVIWRL